MTRFDWGAYLAGELEPHEHAEAERLLAADPSVRRDLEGFREYRKSLQAAAFSEPVPAERLAEALREAAKAPGRAGANRRIAWALAATLLVGLFGYSAWQRDPMAFNTSSSRERLATVSPIEASDWVRENTDLDPPPVDLAPLAKLVGAQYGEGWACYDYERGGSAFYLYFRQDDAMLRRGREGLLGGQRVFVGKGIGWRGQTVSCYLRGGDDATRARLAEAAIRRTIGS